MNLQEVMYALEQLGSEQTRKTWLNHGAAEPLFGVKIGDMKSIRKEIKKDQVLALDLYNTGNADAMYFAGLICEPRSFTKDQLQDWAEKANWYMLREYTVAWAASESLYGRELALDWIYSENAGLRSTGWSTYGCLLALKKDEELDKKEISQLIKHIAEHIHGEENRTRYAMNGFVISAGSYVPELTELAKTTGARIGKVKVNVGNTDCKVPDIVAYIEKVEQTGKLGKKRKTVFC